MYCGGALFTSTVSLQYLYVAQATVRDYRPVMDADQTMNKNSSSKATRGVLGYVLINALG